MVDAASRMECLQCQQIFLTTQFYDHVITQSNCCGHTVMNTQRSNRSVSKHLNRKEDYTLCLDEEDSIINNNPVIYESTANLNKHNYKQRNFSKDNKIFIKGFISQEEFKKEENLKQVLEQKSLAKYAN